MTIRPYAHADRDACVALLVANGSAWFAAHEADEFRDDLDARERLPANRRWPYFVLERDGAIRGCGGCEVRGASATLLWGMVHPDDHGKGFGSALLRHRLDWLAHNTDAQEVLIDTSPRALGFYTRAGFTESGRVAEGYGPGLDKVFARLAFERS